MSSKTYFDHIASQWDTMRSGFFSEAVREKAFAVAEVQPGKLAADIGAGSGFIAEGLLRRGVRVIAVDQSEAMLAEMASRLGKIFQGQAAPECQYLQGSAGSLPLPAGSLDYAFANMYLHHVEWPGAAIAEMAGLLRPGGKLVITDMDEHGFEFLRREQHDRWLGFKREQVKRWFEEAGLRDVVVDCVGENCRAKSESDCAEASVSLFVAWGIR